MILIECINSRFFKLRRNVDSYCLRQSEQNRACQVIPTANGYVVNVFKESKK